MFLLLVTFNVAVGWLPSRMPSESSVTYWALGFVAALLLFASVLLHELSHSFMALARKIKVRDITLYIFGGASNIEGEPQKAADEFLITVVGPLTSLILAGIFWLLEQLVTPPTRRVGAWAASTLEYMAYINFVLALFNLIPAFPLDGGRVLRSLVWAINRNFDAATRIAGFVGQLIAYGFIFLGLFGSFVGDSFGGGLWLAFIGWFLLNAAEQGMAATRMREAVKGVTVGEVMDRSTYSAAPSYTIAHLLSQYFLPRSLRSLPVVQDGHLVGVVTLSHVNLIPQDQWGIVTAADVMESGTNMRYIHTHDRLDQAVDFFSGTDLDAVPVVDRNNSLVGTLTQAHLVKWLQVREQLQKSAPPRT